MHTLMQDGHDADVVIAQSAPVNKMPLVAKNEAFDTKLGRDGPRFYPMGFDLLKCLKQARDVSISLL